MSSLTIHPEITDKLNYFIKMKKIPHIIFHGSKGSGKRTILNRFINNIYQDNAIIKQYVMYVNCAHGKGIKFIREELKFFAKSNINCNDGNFFKSIILANADKLTIDAQSALRRCIELFSHTTRFFIIVEDKYKLLKPILSRFCEIYIPEPIINKSQTNLYRYNLEKTFDFSKKDTSRYATLVKTLDNPVNTLVELFDLIETLYSKAFSALDIIKYIESKEEDCIEKYRLLLTFQKIKKEFRNEKILMLFLLNFIYFRSNDYLENISFM